MGYIRVDQKENGSDTGAVARLDGQDPDGGGAGLLRCV